MEQKLLILALGTTGGEVGLIFKQQAVQRTAKDFYYKMLCLDTSDQLRKSGRLAPHEFVHLATDEHYMNTILANSEIVAQKLHEMLYHQFPPPPSTANGAGGIRYSAATLLALPALQNSIRSNLSTLISQLADMGETKSRDISFAIVISAVGATGSGALSLLIPLMLEAINNAGITKPYIDVIILHPVLSVSDPLLLANAEALYIELAAMQNDAVHNSYAGRKIILGSGGQFHTITQLEELERTAATLIWLTTDAHYGMTQSYWNTLPNRGVLRGLEIQTLLPTHLSSATPVTIGLANLGKQVIEIDTAKLVSRLISGVRDQEKMPTHVNTLLSDLNSFQGHDADTSYQLLLENFTTTLRNRLESNALSPATLTRLNNAQKAERMRSQYHSDLDLIEQEKSKIRPQAQERFREWKKRLNEERRKYLLTDRSLIQLLRDDRERLERIRNLQAAASRVQVSPPVSEELLHQMLHDVARGRVQAMNSSIAAVQQNLASKCKAAAVQIAIMFLNSLEAECQEAIQHVNTFIQKANERFRNKPGWNSNASTLQVHNDHPLSISALSSQQDIEQYYNHVSIFAQRETQQDLFSESDDAQLDPLASFRTKLKEQDLVRHFFDGNSTRIFTAIEQYVEKSVRNQLDNYPLMKVFESMRPAVLHDCLSQAFGRAQSLMPFSQGFASSSVEEYYVTAFWRNERQHSMLQEALSQISQKAKLIKSDEPTEIVVFYLIDGLAMTAINELTGRCLRAFLELRSQWTLHNSNQTQHGSMRGIPVYSGYNFEMQVGQQHIVDRLYEARQLGVGDYTSSQIPELAASHPDASNESSSTYEPVDTIPEQTVLETKSTGIKPAQDSDKNV